MKPDPLYYVARAEGNVAGPYDLVQIAELLRKKIITPETSIRLETSEEWKPLNEQSIYSIVLEIPKDAVSSRIDALNEEAADQASIPLPSSETLIKLGTAAVAILIVGVLSYMIGKTSPTGGHILVMLGSVAAIYALCLIIFRLLDEDFLTLLLVFFVPFYDIFYFITNIWEYFPYFCMKYGGLVMAAAAAAGMAAAVTH